MGVTSTNLPLVTGGTEDDEIISNVSGGTRRISFKTILEKISFKSLTTNAKNIIGAVNELNTNYNYNIKIYTANILSFAETIGNTKFAVMTYRGYSDSGTPINAAPTNSSGIAFISKADENYVFIIAAPYNGGLYSRLKNNGVWESWIKIS